jgi:hypothetical protein
VQRRWGGDFADDRRELGDAEAAGEVVSGLGGVTEDARDEGVVAVDDVEQRVGLVAP